MKSQIVSVENRSKSIFTRLTKLFVKTVKTNFMNSTKLIMKICHIEPENIRDNNLLTGNYRPEVNCWIPKTNVQYFEINGYRGTAPKFNSALWQKVLNVCTINMRVCASVNYIESCSNSMKAVFTVSLPFAWDNTMDMYIQSTFKSKYDYIKNIKVDSRYFDQYNLKVTVKYYPNLIDMSKKNPKKLPNNYFQIELNIMYKIKTLIKK